MSDWYGGNVVAVAWVAIAILAVLVEATITNFLFIFVAIAAVVAAVLAWLGVGLTGQAVVFAALAWLLPVFLRRQLMARFGGPGVPSRTDALIGQLGEVTVPIVPPQVGGRVLVGGEDWAAQADRSIPVGRVVRVVAADGIVLQVEEGG